MSFQDDVREIRKKVLQDPKYKGPIDFLNNTVQSYQVDKPREQTPNKVVEDRDCR